MRLRSMSYCARSTRLTDGCMTGRRPRGELETFEEAVDSILGGLLLRALQLLRMPLERGADEFDLLVRQMFNPDELFACLVDGAQQFVELCLHRRAVAVLAVLDQEHHEERHDRRSGVDHQLPGVGVV